MASGKTRRRASSEPPAVKESQPAAASSASRRSTRKRSQPRSEAEGASPAVTESSPTLFVGIGASAGGLEALRGLLPGLPVDGHVVYVIAQHMDPNHPSLLREILARISPMPIEDVRDDTLPAGGHIYITPPGHNVRLANGLLRLMPVSHIGPKPSVDNFFFSLAENAGARSVGIILSGTGSDGAHGIRAIKGAGGLTLCQDDATAKYNGMPRAAIETGLVDVVQPPERIGPELAALIALPATMRPIATGTRGKTAFEQICQQLLTQTGCDFRNYKPTTLERRISRRMTVNRMIKVDDYVELLRHSPQEVEALFRDILISVTSFFRDPESFAELDRVLLDMVRGRRRGDSLRIWVAGVATGEEAYSIAILLHRAVEKLEANVGFQVFATDIDVDALAIARRGVYLPELVKNVPPDLVERYFVRKDDTYHVVKHIRERVVFARQDLVRDPPFSRLDLVSCRNLLIYFNQRLQKQVISLFHYVLRHNGYLFLGKSEAIGPHAEMFEPAGKGTRVFRALPASNASPPNFGSMAGSRGQPVAEGVAKEADRAAPRDLQARLELSLLRHAPPTGVVVDERGTVQHLAGDLEGFLKLPAGRMDTNILSMIRDDLRAELRGLLHRAGRDGAVSSPILRLPFGAVQRTLRIEVFQIDTAPDEARAFFVLFASQPDAEPPTGDPAADGGEAQDLRTTELEQELVATREHLQTTIEELETSNEELQSTNEELQSANEELQSANEELETSNEELQSTNEELATVNEELQTKSTELAVANADLENVLAIVGLPLLVVDNHLRVTRFTQGATRLFNIKASDIGEAVTTLDCRLPLPNLRNRVLAVIQDEKPLRERLIAGKETWHLRIEPYFSEQRRAVGAVLLFESARAGDAPITGLFGTGGFAGMLLGAMSQAAVVADEKGDILAVNAATTTLFGHPAESLVGQNVAMLAARPWREHHASYISNYLSTGNRRMIGTGREVTGVHRDGRHLALQLDLHECFVDSMRFFVGVFQNLS